MTVSQLSVFVENKPGKLVQAIEALAGADVDIRALSLSDTADFGILRMIVDQPELALSIYKEIGYLVKRNEVIAISVGDIPGGLAIVLRVLAASGVDLEYTYAFARNSHDSAFVVICVTDNDEAVRVLRMYGIQILTPDEVYGL